MKSQNILAQNGLMILWSLLPFTKSKATLFMNKENQFELYTNYPNPFHTITIIYFSLMHASRVQIELLNLMGQKLMTLTDEKMEPGVQRVPLYKVTNGITLTAGTYIYSLIVTNSNGTFRENKFLTVL